MDDTNIEKGEAKDKNDSFEISTSNTDGVNDEYSHKFAPENIIRKRVRRAIVTDGEGLYRSSGIQFRVWRRMWGEVS